MRTFLQIKHIFRSLVVNRSVVLLIAPLMLITWIGTQSCGGGRDYGTDDTNRNGVPLTPSVPGAAGTGSGAESGTVGPATDTPSGESASCASNNDCVLGQLCDHGRCYSQLACDPTHHNTDCPPAEVCHAQAQRCGAPPGTCHFNDECPVGWSCDLDNVCRDPQRAQIGSCAQHVDCNAYPACAGQTCECKAQHCTPRTCTANQDCGANNVCLSGGCRPTRTCADQSSCTPYSMVCVSGHCVPPDPCGTGNTCPVGLACYTNLTPPSCLPTGSNQCSRDEQCGTGEYCDLFTGTCKSGCRNDTDCASKCGTVTSGNQCICSAAHQCATGRPGTGGSGGSGGGPGGGGTTGGRCGSINECSVGTACAPNDPNDFTCAFDDMFGGSGDDGGFGGFGGFGGLGDICPKSCHAVCDLVLSFIVDTCPNGTTCEAPSGVLFDLLNMLAGDGAGVSASSTTGFCY